MTETIDHATLAPLQDAPDEIISVEIENSNVFTIYTDGRLEKGPAWTTFGAAAQQLIEMMAAFMPGYVLVKCGAATGPWQPIETAPKDSSLVLCWRRGWHPVFLMWKTNERIVRAHKANEARAVRLKESYFGDPDEYDDYNYATPGGAPTHWTPVQPPETQP